MKALLVTVEKDSFIKTKIVSEVSSKTIQSLMDIRHEGDYQDFAEITKEEAKESVEIAKSIINSFKNVLHIFADKPLKGNLT